MANVLEISQRAYSKIERNETKLDWDRIAIISKILEIEPVDLINFNDSMVFNNSPQSGKYHTFNNYISDKLVTMYDKRISSLEEEIKFLREMIIRK